MHGGKSVRPRGIRLALALSFFCILHAQVNYSDGQKVKGPRQFASVAAGVIDKVEEADATHIQRLNEFLAAVAETDEAKPPTPRGLPQQRHTENPEAVEKLEALLRRSKSHIAQYIEGMNPQAVMKVAENVDMTHNGMSMSVSATDLIRAAALHRQCA